MQCRIFKQQSILLFLNDLFNNLLIKMTCYNNLFYNSLPHVTTLKKCLSIDLSNTGSLRCFQKQYFDYRPYILDRLKECK